MPITPIADGESGASVRAKLNQALDQLEPVVTTRSLASGAGTLTPTAASGMAILTDFFILDGTAGAGFTLTLANGSATNQRVVIIVTGQTGNFAIDLDDAAAQTISSINQGDVLTFWWTGSTWSRRFVGSSVRDFTGSNGSPVGAVTPGKESQVYRDALTARLWMAHADTSADWTLISSRIAREWVTDGGLLTMDEHSTKGIITNANVVIPTEAGFTCILKAGGTHTVEFNGNTSPAMAAGDVMTIEVQSATVCNAVLTAAANLVVFG